MDLSATADGKSIDWITADNEEFAQRAKFAAGFSRGTYRHDRRNGFPQIELLNLAQTPEQMASLIRFFLLTREGVAEVVSVAAKEGVSRHWDFVAVVRLVGGQIATVDLSDQPVTVRPFAFDEGFTLGFE